MKVNTYTYPKSSFLSLEKDMDIIVNLILKNERLKKLLFYTTKDCLNKPNLTEEESLDLFEKNIKIVPYKKIIGTVENYLFISFDQFSLNKTNPQFKDNVVQFEILCDYEQWQMPDYALRPYKIAAEIDSMLSEAKLSGIGQVHFLSASKVLLDDYGGLKLSYEVIHGGEDKINPLNPKDNALLIENFNKIFNEDD